MLQSAAEAREWWENKHEERTTIDTMDSHSNDCTSPDCHMIMYSYICYTRFYIFQRRRDECVKSSWTRNKG